MISPTASSMLIILNNAKELIEHNERQKAQDVIRALAIYAKNKNFKIPADKIDNFCSVLIDARPNTLAFLIKDITRDVIDADKKNQAKKQIKKNKLPS